MIEPYSLQRVDLGNGLNANIGDISVAEIDLVEPVEMYNLLQVFVFDGAAAQIKRLNGMRVEILEGTELDISSFAHFQLNTASGRNRYYSCSRADRFPIVGIIFRFKQNLTNTGVLGKFEGSY